MTGEMLIAGLTPNVLIVDDAPENLEVLTAILAGAGYNVRPITSGRAALRSLRTYHADLVLLDIVMPDMGGFEVCGEIKQDRDLEDVPVIFISSRQETMDKVRAFAAGGVDYITKPFQNEEVLARVGAHVRLRKLRLELEKHNLNLENLVRLKVREIAESQMATIFALAKLAESRDDDTGRHLERVRLLCRLLAERLAGVPRFRTAVSRPFTENLANAGPLHDIGKVGIPDSILLKPGRLTPDEFEIMKRHTVIGADTLRLVHERYSRNEFVELGIEIARHHHERWDGKGYPDGLAGEAVPLGARILTVVDAYDAMRSKRCYKEVRPHDAALAEIVRGRGAQFDPDIADEFAAMGGRIASEWDRLKD